MKVSVVIKNNGKSVITDVAIPKGASIFSFERNFVAFPTNKTLRIDEAIHQLSTNPEAAENFVNHSCDPNAYINWDGLELRALRDITEGEELTYNYFTSDWDGEDVFECQCGSSNCKQHIGGFRYLPMEERLKIKPLLSPFLVKKFEYGE